MIAAMVHVQVKPEFIEAFRNITQENHENSIKETDNFRFDILQDILDPTKFVLYEVYRSPEAVAAHRETAHYIKWRDTVAPWMAKPREGIKYSLLFPVR
jgi:(4S)-4-hydroxy-5-phosphonooxypentane-2,3-dione isomerase